MKGNWRKSATLEFDRIRKSMSVLCSKQKVNKLFVKGAPDFLLKRCSKVKLPDGSIVPLSASLRQLILEKASSLGERPLRTMALAVKLPSSLPRPLRSWDGRQDDSRLKELLEPENFSKVESDLVFLVFTCVLYEKETCRFLYACIDNIGLGGYQGSGAR